MSTISAGNTLSTGFIASSDTTGNLVFQTNGTTTALTLTTGQNATLAKNVSVVGSVNAVNTFGFKNRIINGGMTIDQRNAGALTNPAVNATYYLDRWYAISGAASKYSIGQNAGAVTPPAGFINYLGCTSLSAYTVGASEQFVVRQAIEGLNIADLAWGTASAKTITISAQVRSSLTGTFGGSIYNNAGDRSYPFTYSISTANTWTSISVTIAGDTSGTWLTTNGVGIYVGFSIGAGATVSGTAGSWSSTLYRSATGATSVVGTSGATFYITGVQLEVGSQATSFDFRDYGRELILCQRYYESNYNPGNYPSASSSSLEGTTTAIMVGSGVSGMAAANSFRVYKRTAPTMTMYSYNGTAGKTSILDNATTYGTGIVVISRTGNGGFGSGGDPGAGLTAGVNYWFGYTANAEL